MIPEEEARPSIEVRMRSLRRERRLTQEELADALGISRQSINAMEAGRTLPSLPMALQIATYFSVPLNAVFCVDAPGGSLLPVLASDLPWQQAFATQRGQANLWDAPDTLYLEILAPGLRREELSLDVGEKLVIVQAEPAHVTMDWVPLKREFRPQAFEREIELPVAIRADAVQAQLQHGILRMLLPKQESSRPLTTRVPITSID
jgi:putative transcriptional regulator